jgi:NAD(P)-dependent dehydrogenase (short-subunit alcohol dehydrogenase family)
MQDLAGKVAVVTGGASGIGLAMARRFGQEGMRLVLADIERSPLEAAAAQLADAGHEVLAVPTDVSSPDSVAALAAVTFEQFGTAHLVCNNAGVGPPGGILETPLAEWRWIMDVNFWGVLHGVRTFVPRFVDQNEGHVVNTASVAGLLTQPGMAAYNVSKHGVVVLSESLLYEMEMLEARVGVSVVCPAWTRTAIHESDRNRAPGAEGAAGPVTERVRAAADRLYERSHRSPGEVAERVLEAVLEDRFYVITHPGVMPFVERRHEDIRLQRNPSVEQGL